MSSSVLEPLTHQYKDEKACSPATRPIRESYDSGEEFSLARYVHAHELVEIEDQVFDRHVFGN